MPAFPKKAVLQAIITGKIEIFALLKDMNLKITLHIFQSFETLQRIIEILRQSIFFIKTIIKGHLKVTA